MTRNERAKLRTELSKLIVGHQINGNRITTSQIYEEARERMPDLIDDMAERLIRSSIQDMARQIMKSSVQDDDLTQAVLPIEIIQMRVPRQICVFREDDQEGIWAPIHRATPNEVVAYANYLLAHSRHSEQKSKRLFAFIDELAPDDMDAPIEVLLRLRRAA